MRLFFRSAWPADGRAARLVLSLVVLLGSALPSRAFAAPIDDLVSEGTRKLEKGDAQGALGVFERAATLGPLDPRPRYLRGAALAQLGRHDAAVTAYREALSLDNGIAEVHNELGVALVAQNKLSEAIREFSAAVSLKPAYPEAWANYERALLKRGDTQAAIDVLKKGCAALPQDVDLRIDLSAVLRQQKRLDEALLYAREAVKLQGRSADAHLNLGLTLQARKQLDEAAVEMARATELRPDMALAWRALGTVERERLHPDAAIAAFQRALALKPSVSASIELALALNIRGDYNDAERVLGSALELKPQSVPLRLALARTYGLRKKCKEAASVLAPVSPQQPDVRETRRELAERCGKTFF